MKGTRIVRVNKVTIFQNTRKTDLKITDEGKTIAIIPAGLTGQYEL